MLRMQQASQGRRISGRSTHCCVYVKQVVYIADIAAAAIMTAMYYNVDKRELGIVC